MGNVGGTFAFSVISFYSLYRAWSSSSTYDSSMEMAVGTSICCIYYNFYIVAMLWAGSTMRNEVMSVFSKKRKRKNQKINKLYL